MAEGDPHTKYINPPIDGGNGNNSTWMKAYRAYLDPRYHYRGNIRCNRQPTLDAAQIFYDKMLEKARELPGNGGVPRRSSSRNGNSRQRQRVLRCTSESRIDPARRGHLMRPH